MEEEKTCLKRIKNVKVFYRIFPMHKMRWDYIKILENRKSLFVRYLQGRCNDNICLPKYWRFDTDGVFYNNTQQEVYDTVINGVIERVVHGHNVVILNFGQTGSGKTLSATGLNNCYKDRGIALRLIADVFRIKNSLKEKFKMCIQMDYIETKNMYFKDLLSHNYELNLRNIRDITIVKVKCEEEAMKLLFTAESRREFADDSVISHVANGVLTFTVIMKPVHFSNPTIRTAKVHIVDMGGCDFYGAVTSSHKNLFELSSANRTKFNLEQFMLRLIKTGADPSANHTLDVLLQYLGDSFNGGSILRFIGHIRVEKENLVVTQSMLKFGQTLRGIKPQVLQPNLSKDKDMEILSLEDQLKEMQKAKDLSYMMGFNAPNISQGRIQQMQNAAHEYLLGKTDEIVVCSITEVAIVLKVFKELYNKLENYTLECTKLAYENAYQDALRSISKTDSATSTKAIKRTSKSIRSKDSIMGGKKISTSSKLVAPQKSESTVSKSLLLDKASTASKSVRRSRASVNARKKSGSIKKRSVNGSDISPRSEIIEDVVLPSSTITSSEAWESFVNDPNYNYQELERERLELETSAKASQRVYTYEAKALQASLELVDIRKFELQKAKMIQLFAKQYHTDDCSEIPSDYEKRCVENLESAKNMLLYQQEKVLKYQSDFFVDLKSFLNAKKNITEKFEEFCQKQYQILIPNLDKDVEVGVNDSCIYQDEVSSLALDEDKQCSIYNKLQRLMKKEIRKIKLTRKIQSKKNL